MSERPVDGMAEYGRPYQGLPAHKRYRRTKALRGEDIELAFEQRHDEVSRKDKGIYCKNCGRWKSWNKVTFAYELVGDKGAIGRRTVCECGTQIKEDIL